MLKWSNWHITCNFNRPRSEANAVIRQATPAFREVFAYDNAHHWLRYYNNNMQSTWSPAQLFANVDTIRARIAFEVDGDENPSAHAHILLEVGHRSSVQIDSTALREKIVRETGVQGLYLNIRFVPGVGEDKAFVLDYISKQIPRIHGGTSAANRKIAQVFGNSAAQMDDIDN